MPTCQNCAFVFPNRQVIDGKQRNLCKRKYCLDCSPFGKHNTKKITSTPKTHKICPNCDLELPIDSFYKRRGDNASPYCKKCMISKNDVKTRAMQIKQQCIKYKGGKCIDCGYSACSRALSFHHRDPSQKNFTISSRRNACFETLKAELDLCDLLCSRCHRLRHARQNEYKFQDTRLEVLAGKNCTSCRKSLPITEFYSSKKRAYKCKLCYSKEAYLRRRKIKMQAVNYKGSTCLLCGYNENFEVMDFHHIDSTLKDFEIGKGIASFESIKAELDKCALLCANCHMAVHENPNLLLTQV